MATVLGPYVVFGSTFEVAADAPLDVELDRALGDLLCPEAGPAPHRLGVRERDGEWTTSWDDTERYVGPEIHTALYDALIAINIHGARVAVEAGHTVLHGGAVDIGGRAIAVVGHSGAGKSTFTTAMTRAGHRYLADEVVAVDEAGSVLAFHRPIGLRLGGAEQIGHDVPAGPYEHMHPYRVGPAGPLAGSAPLAGVALLKRSEQLEGPPRLEPLGAAEALFVLANQTLGAMDLEREMFRRLDAFVRRVPVARLHYTELADAMRLAEQFASQPSGAAVGAADG